jgi:uncharacterized membrane-anchored protein
LLAQEVHARPPISIQSPCHVSYVAVMVESAQRFDELEQIQALCAQVGADKPAVGATHHLVKVGGITFKWERHGEFSSFTYITNQTSQTEMSFGLQLGPAAPQDWLARVPGQTIAAVQAIVRAAPKDEFDRVVKQANNLFTTDCAVGSEIMQNRATFLTDFQLKPDGFVHIVLLDHGMTDRQIGQSLQRLFEIEAYRMLALLSLPIARRQGARILEIEKSLSKLTDSIAAGGSDDETLLNRLTQLAAQIESAIACSQFRFSASRAYYTLVNDRIADFCEQSLAGTPTLGQFMRRRFAPAIATIDNTSQRLHSVSERIAQASGLLSTRVEIARERQNQRLLSSMDSRARVQLRLQQTVEGLSVAAIVYYLVGLVSYITKAIKSTTLPFSNDWIVAGSVPVLAAIVFLSIKRARRRLAEEGNV